jgi:hypothetical protein
LTINVEVEIFVHEDHASAKSFLGSICIRCGLILALVCQYKNSRPRNLLGLDAGKRTVLDCISPVSSVEPYGGDLCRNIGTTNCNIDAARVARSLCRNKIVVLNGWDWGDSRRHPALRWQPM